MGFAAAVSDVTEVEISVGLKPNFNIYIVYNQARQEGGSLHVVKVGSSKLHCY